MKITFDRIMTTVAIIAILAALPPAIIDTFEKGRLHLFSSEFIEELPQRFTGPGNFRFIIQPLIAILLGIRGGLADAKSGKPPYIFGILHNPNTRKKSLRTGIADIRNLIALGIIFDLIFQFFVLGAVHPGAAIVIGPLLICVPYAMSRALTNRLVCHHPKINR